MIENLELPLSAEEASRAVSPEAVEVLLCGLADGRWHSAEQLAQWMSFGAGDNAKRHVRALAAASDGRVLSYPGSPGYKLTMLSTPEDMNPLARTRHQAKQMIARTIEIERVWHGRKMENA